MQDSRRPEEGELLEVLPAEVEAEDAVVFANERQARLMGQVHWCYSVKGQLSGALYSGID